MTSHVPNRIVLSGRLIEPAKSRTVSYRDGAIEFVSLWIEVRDEARADRFTVEIACAKAAARAKALPADALVEVTGRLRHDRWKDKASGRWTGKVFVSIEPGDGALRAQGLTHGPAPQPAV